MTKEGFVGHQLCFLSIHRAIMEHKELLKVLWPFLEPADLGIFTWAVVLA